MKISKTQIVSLIVALLGITYGALTYFIPNISIWGNTVFDLFTGFGITGIAGIIGTIKGYAVKTQAELEKAQVKEKLKEQCLLEKQAEIEAEKQLADKQLAEKNALKEKILAEKIKE